MTTKRKAWIFDVDGTLADIEPFLHHIKKTPKDFDAFHADAINAELKPETKQLYCDAWRDGFDIIVVTARMEKHRAHTSYWLTKKGIAREALFMRPNRDYRPDYEIKSEILDQIEKVWDVIHAVDDNPKVIAIWESRGIPTTKIGTWDGNH